MIDDQVNWAEWVDLIGITTESHHGITHSSEVNDCGDTSEILENDSSWLEWNLDLLGSVLLPSKNLLNVGLLDIELIAVTHRRLQQHTDGVRELLFEKGRRTTKVFNTQPSFKLKRKDHFISYQDESH